MKCYKKSLKIPKGNQNPYIEKEQTIQWPKSKKRTNNDLQNITQKYSDSTCRNNIKK